VAWIHVTDENNATGTLAELYKRIATPGGTVDNILKIHSLNPTSLGDHLTLYRNLMQARTGLGRMRREMIAVVTSAANSCHY